ncbi:uncharacterized protein WCC33_006337 [Rhinophrynus dorsalis]
MGCSVSCAFFEKFSSALHWAVEKRAGVAHYLDDFLFVVEKGSEQAGNLLKCAEQLFEEVGVPVAHDKTVLPTTKLSYLGIEIDSEEGQVRLPLEKVLKARAAVVGMVGRQKVSLREMQGLLGLLNFASRVIPMGRIFSRRLERATVGVRRPLHKIRITRQLREDLKVWEAFLINFNGVRLWREPPRANGQMQLYTDAAGAVGFGAFFQGQWCAERWPEAWHSQGLTRNLVLLELFPIVVALELWYEGLANKEVVFWTDNMSVVYAINRHLVANMYGDEDIDELITASLAPSTWRAYKKAFQDWERGRKRQIRVFVLGHSFVHWAHQYLKQRQRENLGMPQESMKIIWCGGISIDFKSHPSYRFFSSKVPRS